MPRLLMCLVIALLVTCAGASSAQTDAAVVKAVIQTKAPEFSGAMLVVRKGQIILNEAFGLASRQLDVRNTPAMRFRIASITKLFTAVIVLKLVEQGKLDPQKHVVEPSLTIIALGNTDRSNVDALALAITKALLAPKQAASLHRLDGPALLWRYGPRRTSVLY